MTGFAIGVVEAEDLMTQPAKSNHRAITGTEMGGGRRRRVSD